MLCISPAMLPSFGEFTTKILPNVLNIEVIKDKPTIEAYAFHTPRCRPKCRFRGVPDFPDFKTKPIDFTKRFPIFEQIVATRVEFDRPFDRPYTISY